MNTWQDSYKAMTADELAAEWQRLLSGRKWRDHSLGDKLKLLSLEFRLRNKHNGLV